MMPVLFLLIFGGALYGMQLTLNNRYDYASLFKSDYYQNRYCSLLSNRWPDMLAHSEYAHNALAVSHQLQANTLVLHESSFHQLPFFRAESAYGDCACGAHTTFAQANINWNDKQLTQLFQVKGACEVFMAREQYLINEIGEKFNIFKQCYKFAKMETKNPELPNACTIESMLALNDLKVSPPSLNIKFQEWISEIQNTFTTPENRCYQPMLNLRDHPLTPISKRENSIKEWIESPEGLVRQCIFDTREFLKSHPEQFFSSSLNNWDVSPLTQVANRPEIWGCLEKIQPLASHDQKLRNEIASNPKIKDLVKVVELCHRGKFQEAYTIMMAYERHDLEWSSFMQVYKEYFFQKYTPEGIDTRYINDPYYQEIKNNPPQFKDNMPFPHEQLNKVFAVRKENHDRVIQFLKVQKVNSVIDVLAYELGTIILTQQEAVLPYLVSHLSNDHQNPEVRDAYDQIFLSNGLPKFFTYNEQAANCDMPISIGNGCYAQEKELLFNLATIDVRTAEEMKFVERGLNYIKASVSLSSSAHTASFCRVMVNVYVQALDKRVYDHPALQLADYTKIPGTVHQNAIREAAITFITKNIDSQDWHSVKNVNEAYTSMLAGSLSAEDYLHRALVVATDSKMLAINYDERVVHFKAIGENEIAAQIEVYKNIAEDIKQHGARFELITYTLPSQLKNFLQGQELDSSKYASLYGHQLQQEIHKNVIEQAFKADKILQSLSPESASLYQAHRVGVQLFDAGRAKNAAGDMESALTLTNFSSQLFNYIDNCLATIENSIHTARINSDIYLEGQPTAQRALLAVAEGAVHGVRGFTNVVFHPQQIITGLQNLVATAIKFTKLQDHIDNTLVQAGDECWGIRNLDAYQRATQEVNTMIAPVINAIKEGIKNTSVEDGIKQVTAGIVEAELFGSALAKAEELAQCTKAKILESIPASHSLPEIVAVTAEGIEARIPHAAENYALSEHVTSPETAQKGVKSTQEFIPASNIESYCPPSCVNQYEKLKEALKIEEFTSIIKCTEHGLQRLIERGFEPDEIRSLFLKPDYIRMQNDGAKVFIQKIEDRFRIIVFNEKTGELVTALKNTTEKKIINLGENYGWKL